MMRSIMVVLAIIHRSQYVRRSIITATITINPSKGEQELMKQAVALVPVSGVKMPGLQMQYNCHNFLKKVAFTATAGLFLSWLGLSKDARTYYMPFSLAGRKLVDGDLRVLSSLVNHIENSSCADRTSIRGKL